MVSFAWRTPNLISAYGPEDWFPLETLEIRQRDGAARVSVESWPVGSATLAEVVAEHGERVLADGRWLQASEGEATVLGWPQGRQRVGVLDRDDEPGLSVSIGYALHGGRAYVVTSILDPSAAEPEKTRSEAVAIAASVRAMPVLQPPLAESWPLGARSGDVANAGEQARGLVGSSTEGWSTVTFEEALAAAAHFGVATLPGVDPRYLSSLDSNQRSLALEVALRSLRSRLGEAGSERGKGDCLLDALQLAAGHDLLVILKSTGRSGSTSWFAGRADRVVVTQADPGRGLLRMRLIEAAELVDAVIGDSSSAAEEAGGGSPFRLSAGALSDGLFGATGSGDVVDEQALAAVGGAGATLISAQTLHRVGAAIAGGELEWIRASDGRLLRVERTRDAQADVTPLRRDELAAALSALLPAELAGTASAASS